MIDYVYKAKNASGEIVSASVKAESPQAAAKVLMQQGLFPLDVTPEDKKDILERLGIHRGVKAKDRVLFTRQLSTLINAGLPLAKSLHSVQDQISNPNLKEVIASVTASVEGGSSLANAFSQYPKVFNEIYVALVAAGETSGTLDEALVRLANQQEKDAAIAAKIRSAMIYPAIVLVLIIGVVGLMVTTVVPQVARLYHDLHKTLPLPTQILMALSDFMTHFWWAAIIVLALLVIGARRLLKQDRVITIMDDLKLKLPVFGQIFKKVYMARFARTLGTLLSTGIPMLQSLETTRRAVSNRVIQADLDKLIPDVRGGKALSKAIEDNAPHFIPLVPQMIDIGEESGAIADMTERVATYYENEVDEAVKNLSTTLEPVMMVVLGGIVALVLIAVLGPVYSLVGSSSLNNAR